MLLGWPLVLGAFGAGVGMFFAPCTLPIVPGYLGFIGGGDTASRGKVLRNAVAFVLGFSAIFIVMGTFAVALGHVLGPLRSYLPQIAGAIIILFGLTMLGLRVPFLSAERHVRLPSFLVVGRPSSSLFIGALFALGWSPCIGPILGTILLVASASATALQGALLLGVFSAGLAVPFLLSALLLNATARWFARLGRLSVVLGYFNALLLIAVGLLMFTNTAGLFVTWAFEVLRPFGYDALLNYL